MQFFYICLLSILRKKTRSESLVQDLVYKKKNFSYRISHKNSLTLFPGETFKAVENVRLFIQGYFLRYVNNKCIVTKNFKKTKKNSSN